MSFCHQAGFTVTLISLITQTTLCWGITAPPSKLSVFPNQSIGAPRLGQSGSPTGKQPELMAQEAWKRLKSMKGTSSATVEFSVRTGLPHSVAYLKTTSSGRDLAEKARRFLSDQRDLFLKGKDVSDLSLDKIRSSTFTGSSHVDFLQTYRGLRVYGAGLTVHFDAEENVVMVNGEYVPDLVLCNETPGAVKLSRDEALSLALKRFGKLGSGFHSMGEPEEIIYSLSPSAGANYLAYRYTLLGPVPGADGTLFADAYTGEPLALFPLVCYLNGTATLYDPNSAQSGLVQRTLTDLDDSGKLRGPLLVVLDEENERVVSPSRAFNYSANSPGFRQASVYYYLTETRKRLRALGFNDTAAGALPATVNALNKETGGQFNNAFYHPIMGGFVFGNGDGSVFNNLAQDFDVASHEFGHFFDDVLINTEQTPLHTPRRAWGEACGDIIAAIINGDPNVGESSVPGKPFLRTINNTKKFPNDLVNEEHLDGEIYGGACWDFMKLRAGGTVNQAARDEMARVLIAGIPFIPMTNVQYSDILKAFIQGDQTRGGVNVNNLRTAFSQHGITETGSFKSQEKHPAKAVDKGVAGFQELQNGVPLAGTLSDGFYADFYIQVPAGATSLTVQTFVPGFFNQGDVILRVAPGNYTNLNQIYNSDLGLIQEGITITNASPVPLNMDTVWLIEVADKFDGFYSEVGVVATVQGGSPQIQQIFFNQAVNGRIDSLIERDVYYFPGAANQVIELSAVKRGDFNLDPLILLGNSVGELLTYDDDSGGNQNARIAGFKLPAADNYIVVVMSSVNALGPVSIGDYTLLLTAGTPPPPTPTPGPTPIPGGVTSLTSGVMVTGTVGPSDPATGNGASSNPYKIEVPAGARELHIRVNESPVPAGNFILQVRKGQPVGNTLDDYVGLGGRKSAVVVTPNSRVPLSAGQFFLLFFNMANTTKNFQLVATIEGGGIPGAEYDRVDDGKINPLDLLSLIKSNPSNMNILFDFARYWKRTGL